MKLKLKSLFGSLRFWLATSVAITAVLEMLVSGDAQLAQYFDIIQIWIGAVVGIGTLDSIAAKFGGLKK